MPVPDPAVRTEVVTFDFEHFTLKGVFVYVNGRFAQIDQAYISVGGRHFPVSRRLLRTLRRKLGRKEACRHCGCMKTTESSLVAVLREPETSRPAVLLKVAPGELCWFKSLLLRYAAKSAR